MKRIFLFLLILPQLLQAQTLYTTRLDTNDFYHVYFASSQLGFILGENGTILRTEDAGTNWNPVSAELKDSVGLRDMVFVNDTLGFATGDKGTVIQTIDGGTNWMELPVDESGPLGPDFGAFHSVSFHNDLLGWVAGDNGEVQLSLDGGLAWERKDIGFMENVRDIMATSDTSALAVLQDGRVIYTENYGDVWEEAFPFEDSTGESPSIFSMSRGDNYAYVVGTPGTYASPFISHLDEISNDWQLWQHMSNPIVAVDSANPHFTDAYFTTRDTGWVIGWDKLILYTQDNGQSWTQIISPDTITNELNGVTITPDSQEVWIVGNDGLVISTHPFPIPIGLEAEIHREFTLYPNPSHGRFFIKNPFSRPQEALLMIYDLQGKLVTEQPVAFSSIAQQAVSFPGLQEGIYILQMVAEGELFRPQKLIIKPRP